MKPSRNLPALLRSPKPSARIWYLLLTVLWMPSLGFAQLTIQGKITDDRGEALPSANVIVVGTTYGAAADLKGEYKILVPAPGTETVVEARFLGYKASRKSVTQRSGIVEVNFELPLDILQMEQVVVTGTSILTEKANLGNSIATLSARDLENIGAGQLDAALTGKIPGALVQLNSGTPGGGATVRIRGTSTISRSADPLYIIDGVILDNSSTQLVDLGGYTSNRLADLNPDDIERIEVVKGAAAAALYGSRANDGVVQIFTKRGQAGQLRVSYKNTIGFDHIVKKLDVNEHPFNKTGAPVTRYDYQDNLFRTGVNYNTTLSLSGGEEKTKYYVSAGYLTQDGILEATNYKKQSIRFNLDRVLTSSLNLSTSMDYVHSKAQLVPNGGVANFFGVLTNFLFNSNDYSLFPDPVTGKYPAGFFAANPLEAVANWKAPQEVDRFIGGLKLNFAPVEGLSLEYRFGFDGYAETDEQFVPRESSAPSLITGLAISASQRSKQLNSDFDANYTFQLSPTIRSSSVVGMNYQYQEYNIVTSRAEDLALLVETVQGSKQFSSQFLDKRRTIGFYGQETIAVKERLFLTGSLRADASSTFGSNERWQLFPKASASFALSDLTFWQESFGNTINRMKVRAALGYSGGQPAESYSQFSNYIFEPNGGRSGVVNSSLQGNEDLKPERMREIEVGSDLEFLSGRIGVEMTYYDQEVKDLILPKPVPASTGFTQQLANVGVLSNKGFELLARSINVRTPSLTWTTTVNFSTNTPKVEELTEGGAFPIPGSFTVVWVGEDEPPGYFFGTTYVRDASGNITLNSSGIPIIGPRAKIGDPNPDFTWSLINEVSIGSNLNVRFQFDGVMGQDAFNFDRRLLDTPAFGGGKDYERELRGEVPVGFFQARRSIFEEYIEDASYIKLREVTVQYTFRGGFVERVGLRNLQLHVTGRNLFTITDFRGWDPESNVAGQSTVVRGFPFATIPIPRSILFGVTANL